MAKDEPCSSSISQRQELLNGSETVLWTVGTVPRTSVAVAHGFSL